MCGVNLSLYRKASRNNKVIDCMKCLVIFLEPCHNGDLSSIELWSMEVNWSTVPSDQHAGECPQSLWLARGFKVIECVMYSGYPPEQSSPLSLRRSCAANYHKLTPQ